MFEDSQAALAAQDCLEPGQVKATYDTDSSVILMAGDAPMRSIHGLVTSIAWNLQGRLSYVLEGNLNYTGAVVTWLKDQVHMIESPDELEGFTAEANPNDICYFVPAFTGLGAPLVGQHSDRHTHRRHNTHQQGRDRKSLCQVHPLPDLRCARSAPCRYGPCAHRAEG